MTKIIVKDREGNVQELSADIGLTLMEIIRDAGLKSFSELKYAIRKIPNDIINFKIS